MPEPAELFALGNASIVAPAGHGKTEILARVAALGVRALVLTHTHTGVHAIRARLKRLRVPYSRVSVDTIAGWAMRYSYAFPKVAQPPQGMPQGAQWEQLYRGARLALGIKAVRDVIAASYDKILIDEYQDCGVAQHELAIALAGIVPTIVLGDPMQGIFEFAGVTLDWPRHVYPHFPLAGTLEVPHRWTDTNPGLGAWVAETRTKLEHGRPIDLADPRITFRESNDAFDMATLFDGIDGKEGKVASIHCNKMICYRLAKAAGGAYQAIEEIAAARLRQFAEAWDGAVDGDGRLRTIRGLIDDCFRVPHANDEAAVDPDAAAVDEAMGNLERQFREGNGVEAAVQLLALSRKHPRWKLFRNELWRDAERASLDLASHRADTMLAATTSARQRLSVVGRKLPFRTVATPLLLKGLEFDHVIIPHASHFARERQAQAKLFYVAISRATRSLTISSPDRWLTLPVPSGI